MNRVSLECTLKCEHKLRMSMLLYEQCAQFSGFPCDLVWNAKLPGCLKLLSQLAAAQI